MSKFHTLYVTKLGQVLVEAAEEHNNRFAAAQALSMNLQQPGPMYVVTVEGTGAVIPEGRLDHALILTPEEASQKIENFDALGG